MNNIEVVFSVLGIALASLGLVYTFLRNFKTDINQKIDAMEKRLDLQDERIFLLATGKTLREAMVEAKKHEEDRRKEK